MDVIRRKFLLLLLFFIAVPSPLMAADPCSQTPTTRCLINLAAPDINIIPEDKREPWQRLYEQFLVDEVLGIFERGDMDALWLSLDTITSTAVRSQAVAEISHRMTKSGDKQLLELIWEMDSDLTRLLLMLRVIDDLLKSGYRDLAEKVYVDAQFVFRRLGDDELSDNIYKKMISAAKKFDDTLLLSTLADGYQRRMAGKADPAVLMRSGAYAQALQVASRTLEGKERANYMQRIATGWLTKRGEQALLTSVTSASDVMFRAAAMLALGKHARNELKNPILAEEYLTKAVHHADIIESIPARDELYEDIGREYRKLAKEDKLDLDEKIFALAKKITDFDDSISLQFETISLHLESKDFARAEAILQRENDPILSSVYHYILAEMAREAGDISTAIVEIQETQRFIDTTEHKELRYELKHEMGKFLRKVGDAAGAINAYQEAATLALELPLEKRLKALNECAKQLRRLGAEQEAAAISAMLANEISTSGNDAASMAAIINFIPALSGQGVSTQISQRLYEMESLLQDEALVKFFMKRAESSHDEGKRQATLRFLNMALQQAVSEQQIRSSLDKGLDFFNNSETFSLRLSLLQHPAIPDALLQKILQKYFQKYLKNKERGDLARAEALAELMPEEKRFDALAALLAHVVDEGDKKVTLRLYTQLQQLVKEKPQFKVPLLELMIDEYDHALAIHYKDDVEKMIAALVDRGAVLYLRALQLKWHARLSSVGRGEMRQTISREMLQLATLSTAAERGRRAMTYLLFARALSDSH